MGQMEEKRCIRILCRSKLILCKEETGLQWLIGSPSFFPPFTILSSFRSLHSLSHDDPFSPDFLKEADDLRTLLLRGFDVIGALFINNRNWEENARRAAEASYRMSELLYGVQGNSDMIGAAADPFTGDIRFFVYGPGKSTNLEAVDTIIYEDNPEKFVWEIGCLLRCELTMKLPIYIPVNRESGHPASRRRRRRRRRRKRRRRKKTKQQLPRQPQQRRDSRSRRRRRRRRRTRKEKEAGDIFSFAVEAAAAKFKDPNAAYMVDGVNVLSEEVLEPIVLRHNDLDFRTDLSEVKLMKNDTKESDAKTILCSHFCSKARPLSALTTRENADAIQVTVLFNQSRNAPKHAAPHAEYFPASEPARLLVTSFKLDVLSYASKDLPVSSAVSKLIVPGLVDQLIIMKKAILPSLSIQHPQPCPYHFFPPGFLHPITAIYELSYGETEMKQVEIRRSLHLRLGLPLDRPLLLIANAVNFGVKKGTTGINSIRNGSYLLKDVHTEIPGSGVSGGVISLVEGSYEYYHYLQDGFDDSGWGCAYRSLQTIISWFRLQHYTSIDVPSHREIQQALVEIGDKEPSFMGSREWIGAIELSFVLDKLLAVSCKIINVRSGAELPEKCRELAMHFETQGTPVMIGGGVLAYTLLGVDYNETSGDCAFLILDPHYTGNDELKKIISGGWCGWKKAVDSKGRNFFLHDKFYNLLLPQRPNMV